jgi:hypothetical protein
VPVAVLVAKPQSSDPASGEVAIPECRAYDDEGRRRVNPGSTTDGMSITGRPRVDPGLNLGRADRPRIHLGSVRIDVGSVRDRQVSAGRSRVDTRTGTGLIKIEPCSMRIDAGAIQDRSRVNPGLTADCGSTSVDTGSIRINPASFHYRPPSVGRSHVEPGSAPTQSQTKDRYHIELGSI